MPTQIDRCASCGNTVFLEDAVPGGCSCPERGLRLLLAAQRQRNAQGGEHDFASVLLANEPAALPALDPGLLMSQAGRGEFEAARQVAAPVPPRGRPRVAAMVDDASFFGGEDWTGDWREPQAEESVANMSQMDLAAMWLQGSGVPFDPSQLVNAGTDDFEFSTGDDIDVGPRMAAPTGDRFRVDRAPPQRTAFDRTMVNSQGPMRETTRVRERFAVLREVQPAPPPTAPAPPVQVPMTRPSALQQARMLQASTKPGASSYDRLRRNPFAGK